MNLPGVLKWSVRAGVAAMAMLVACSGVGAADTAVRGRELLQRQVDAVIGVELVVTVKVKMGDREMPPRERRVEVNGTVLTADGLTVTSLAQVDPQAEIEGLQAMQPGRKLELLGADFTEVKLRRADGTEVPARFVLKDADLDLAFMAPVVAEGAERVSDFHHVDLANKVEGQVMDSFYMVTRAPKMLQRVPMMRRLDVMGVVERPRKFYLVTEPSLGSPAFDAEGRILGIALQHFSNGRRTGIVVLPADDIAEIAKQAQAAQAKPEADANADAAVSPPES